MEKGSKESRKAGRQCEITGETEWDGRIKQEQRKEKDKEEE